MARLLVGLCFSASLGASVAAPDEGLGDVLGLMQHATASQRADLERSNVAGGFDCKEHPELCQAPFNCQDATGREGEAWKRFGVGKVDLKVWCSVPQYGPYISKCLAERDPEGAAQYQFGRTVRGDFGKFTAEMDGSYCFLEGLCTDESLGPNTTLQEAETKCDQRYGPQRWRSFGSPAYTDKMESPADPSNGFTSRRQTTPFLVMACAMGNFHCDAVYCKSTYCRIPYYKQKYGHFLKENGWVK